jgi:ring-1,2-phenylacetyl-CoA epoxidase subunit PaaE
MLTDTENELKFYAGQFITVVLFYNNKYLFKSFSIASPPFELPKIELVFRNNRDDFTKAVLKLNSGDFIRALPSEGKLTVDAGIRNNIVFIAMGSGITPFMSIIRDELNKKNRRNILLFYANRYFNTAYFIDELLRFDKEEKIKLFNYFSRETDIKNGRNCRLTPNVFEEDFINTGMNFYDCDFFLCGSSEFVAEFRNHLSSKNINLTQIHVEEYDYEKTKKEVEEFMKDNKKAAE